jgi:hypothetical protein
LPYQALGAVGGIVEKMRSRNHHVRPMFKNVPERFGSINRLCHDFYIRLIFEQAPDSLPKQRIIVNQDTTNLAVRKSVFWLDLSVEVHRSSSLRGQRNRGDAARYGEIRLGHTA